jgi:hypothetical protein
MEQMIDNYAPLKTQIYDLIKKKDLLDDEFSEIEKIPPYLVEESIRIQKRFTNSFVLGLGIVDVCPEMNSLFAREVQKRRSENETIQNEIIQEKPKLLSIFQSPERSRKKKLRSIEKRNKKHAEIILLYTLTRMTYALIAQETKCTLNEVQNVLKKYRQSQEIPKISAKIAQNNRRITEKHLRELKTLYEKEEIRDKSLKEKAIEWRKTCPDLEKIGRETLRMYTKKYLKISYGNLRFTYPASNTEINRKRRKVTVIRLLQLMEFNHRLIYIDECGVGSAPLKRHGWGDERSSHARLSDGRVRNLSVCTAISRRGMECIEFSSTAYDEIQFESFLQKLIEVLREKALRNPEKCILYMDNATFHKTERCMSLLIQTGMPVMFGPPYTPHLNVCEYFFNDMKKDLSHMLGSKR